jgi:hypothetical protein
MHPRASQGNSYVHGTDVNMCTGDFYYTEVGFNTMFQSEKPVRRPIALSLRDRQEPCQYYQYRAIPRYVRFYDAYVKSAKGTHYS